MDRTTKRKRALRNSSHVKTPRTPQEKVQAIEHIFRKGLVAYEKFEPQWFRITVLRIVKDMVFNLRQYIESGKESSTSWTSPQVVIMYPVKWEWADDGNGRPISVTVGADDLDDRHALKQKLTRGVFEYARIHCLGRLTGNAALMFEPDGQCWRALMKEPTEILGALPQPQYERVREALRERISLRRTAASDVLAAHNLAFREFLDDPVDLSFSV